MHDEELNLDRLIGKAMPPIDDAGFTDVVLGRLKRRIWTRRLVLSGATVAGLALALPFFSELVFGLSDQLTQLANNWDQVAKPGEVSALLNTVPARDALLQIGGFLGQVGDNWNDPEWYMQFGVALPASLLALLSPLLARFLEA